MVFKVSILLICIVYCIMRMHCQPVDFEHDQWTTGFYPFPEMNRFLNSHPRIHRPSHSFSLLGYICSIANDKSQIEGILQTFGTNYRSLIKTIIKEDCTKYHQQHRKRTMNYTNRNAFIRKFLRNLIDYYEKI